ncbi:MAG: flagellar filament capping protein FliD [Methylohalobius sp. ZOD2]
MPVLTSTGLGSGLDISGMVQSLVQVERQPVAFQQDRREAELQTKLSSYGTFKSALSSFRSSLAGLRQSSGFEALKATSSDESILTASAETNADPGEFSLEVKQLATSHSLASGGFADPSEVVGSGTLTIRFGTTDYDPVGDTYNGFTQNPDQGVLTLNLDASNNTLTGLRDAINEADAGVNASIVNDGAAYRLVLSSEKTGADNSIQIDVSDGDGNDTDAAGLSRLAFNAAATHMTQTRAAQDAIVGIDGLDVTSPSNTLDQTLKGITLNLEKANPGEHVQLSVQEDTSGIVEAVGGFVENFNKLMGSVKELTGYDPASQTGGALLGDAAIRTGVQQIRRVMGDVVSGLEDSSIRTLADLGIRTQVDGTLEFDQGKLESALKQDPKGVAAVFSVTGIPANERVQYLDSTEATESGEYGVEITQAATRGVLNGGAVSSLSVDANNDTFRVRVDGTLSGQIQLTQKTYASHDELATEIQARINGDSTLRSSGGKVTVNYDSANNRFVIESQSHGSDSQVEITEVDTNTTASLGLGVAVGTVGQDVAGTIGGNTADGEGRFLTATQGDAEGMKLFIEGGASGSLGSVAFSRGLMEKLDSVLGGLLESDGTISARMEGLQKGIDQIGEERVKLNERMANLEQRLLDQFNAMDLILGRLQTTGDFLGQQLATLPFNNLSSNSK